MNEDKYWLRVEMSTHVMLKLKMPMLNHFLTLVQHDVRNDKIISTFILKMDKILKVLFPVLKKKYFSTPAIVQLIEGQFVKKTYLN